MAIQNNPTLLQKGDPLATPLFLIHDSSGGIFGYYKLEPLGRPLYAIHNPWCNNTEKWTGGTEIFVHKYIELIKSVVSSGDILLGGWSMGGQLAIDIARTLAQNRRSKLQAIGLVMIDTLYPYWGPAGTKYSEIPTNVILGVCPPDMKEQIIRCAEWSRQDCVEWVKRNWKGNQDESDGIEATEPPPAVRIHATEYIPVIKPVNGEAAMLDYSRKTNGGWEHFPHDFIVAVWELPTHHFGFFDPHTVKNTSEKVKRACELLAEE